MKNIIKKAGALLLALIILLGAIPLETFAAENVCILVHGSADRSDIWKTIIIKTGKNWCSNKITFKQDKGTLEFSNHLQRETKKLYGAYTIKVNDGSGEKTYWWKYKETYTLKLKDNTTYTIKIKPYQPKTVGEQNLQKFPYAKLVSKSDSLNRFSSWSWADAPTWKVTSTKAVAWCHPLN